VENPRASAEILLAHLLKMRRIDLYVRYDQPLDGVEVQAFREAVSRRAAGEPAAYIVGTKEFYGMPLSVNRHVLIPRPETEHLVEAALKKAADLKVAAGSRLRILDLGTGSGAVILALAAAVPESLCVASDISFPALRTARENAKRHGLEARIRFVRGDWLSPFAETRTPFDIIVPNPPYVATAVLGDLQPEIRYEPRQALDGGPDGLNAVRRIVSAAHRLMRPGGALLLEIGYDQKAGAERLIRETGAYRNLAFLRDFSGWDRIVSMEKSSSQAGGLN